MTALSKDQDCCTDAKMFIYLIILMLICLTFFWTVFLHLKNLLSADNKNVFLYFGKEPNNEQRC